MITIAICHQSLLVCLTPRNRLRDCYEVEANFSGVDIVLDAALLEDSKLYCLQTKMN